MRAKIVACIVPVDRSDPRHIGDQGVRIRHAIEDEEKVGLGVKPVCYEELQVPPGLLALAIHVCDERAFGLRSGCCGPGDGVCGTREVMY